jgi:epoxyqueuosine reductase
MSASANSEKNTTIVKTLSRELGFLQCGIAQSAFLKEEAPRLENWLKSKMHGEMSYMANHFDMRLDPAKLVPGAKSVISLLYNYTPPNDLPADNTFKIARYAYGKDYHFVIKDKLKDFMTRLQDQIGAVEGRVFVDSAPVMERAWAERSGLGWIGKNSLLLNRNHGSYFFLAEIISDLELIPDGPMGDYCGTCTACMDACPTDAIPDPYIVDASKCISYLTIELKNNIPGEFKGKMNDWIFGCDICQEVCPWNRFAKPHEEEAFKPHPKLEQMSRSDWHELTEEVFKEVFKKSPLKRAKFAGIKRNILFATEK